MSTNRTKRLEVRKAKFKQSYQLLLGSGYDIIRRPKCSKYDPAWKAWQSCIAHARYIQKHGHNQWFVDQGINLPPSHKEIAKSSPIKKKISRANKRKPSVQRTTPSNVKWLPRDEWEKQTEKFYKSQQWKELRYEVLRRDAATCQCCGARASDGLRLHVDHIKPRSKYPELQLDITNLQVLCEDCNFGKSNYYADDWRVKMES